MTRAFPSVVDYAFEVIRMQERIEELETEVERLRVYKQDYLDLLAKRQKDMDSLWTSLK